MMHQPLRLFTPRREPPSLAPGLTIAQWDELYGAATPIREAVCWPIRLGPSISQTGTEVGTFIVNGVARLVLVRLYIRDYFCNGCLEVPCRPLWRSSNLRQHRRKESRRIPQSKTMTYPLPSLASHADPNATVRIACTIMKQALIALFCISYASAYAAATLCSSAEEDVFSCHTATNKIISVCASKDLASDR